MTIDLSYYDGKYPLNFDSENISNGMKYSVGKHSYGIELIKFHRYDPNATFHIGRFCAIANTEFYLGGSKELSVISTGFFIPKFFPNSTYGKNINPSNDSFSRNDILIGNDVWIGNNSTIMPGVQIGDGAVIAANAHIVTNVPPYSIYGGNPGKLIKYRFDENTINALQHLAWWELEDAVINDFIPLLTDFQNEPLDSVIERLIETTAPFPRTKSLVDRLIKKFD